MEKNKLEIIKEGKTGHGILIENDGYISLDEGKNNRQIKEDIADGGWHVPHPFVVDAVFQKYGIKNANGRIYPENVLKREVEKYQKLIDERMALGECYKPDALILTKDGWKKLEEVKEGEKIFTLNLNTKEIELRPIYEKVEYDYDGKLIRIHNKYIDDIVTPDHQYIVFNNNDEFIGRISAKNILNGDTPSNSYIPKKITIDGFDNLNLPSKMKGIKLNKKTLYAKEVPYNGKVVCVKVENHNFYVMCNNKCHWTSNYCNHPAESTIDLSRVSHNIIELHWVGQTLVGKMEINTTEGFRKQGIVSTQGDMVANLLLNGYKIGVSSRAVGSVEQKLGQYIVGEDLELVCWDVVSNPSTPGAYIGTEEQLQQYVESNSTNNSKPIISEKINKIKQILNS